ncbi:GGDEF domain-containing protein [Shewanella donghaensis]|uniref:GGDEF domain-containing protein n=1 Tax=Shewanella donghaensis TaxID=238836 RepID=UPI0011843CF5|nr:GGDEF domain-containing protein [Shewanella donghaensis]
MDAFTLLISTALASAIMFITLFSLYLTSKKDRSLIDWAIAGLLFFLSNMIGLIFFFSSVPFGMWPAALANMCYVLAHLALLVGVRRHLGLKPQWKYAFILSFFVFMFHFIPGFLDSVTHRILFIYPLLIVINVTIVSTLLFVKKKDFRAVYYPFILAEIIFLVQQLARFLVVAFDRQFPLTLAGNELLQTSGTLSVFAFISLITMSCGLIVFRKQEVALRQVSNTDQLTGWMNRRALNSIAEREFELGKLKIGKFSLIMIDIDHFKKINDKYGHQCGDLAIKHITQIASDSMRHSDYLFRFGGEEFLLMFNNIDLNMLNVLSQRLKQQVVKSPLEYKEELISMTISIGFAMQTDLDDNWEILLNRADLALYHSKNEGRNKVSVHDGIECVLLHN